MIRAPRIRLICVCCVLTLSVLLVGYLGPWFHRSTLINLQYNRKSSGLLLSKKEFSWQPPECDLMNVSRFILCVQEVLLSHEDQRILMHTFYVLSRLLDSLKVPHFLWSGSLLGWMRHGGRRIPYDDDIDIFLSLSDKARVNKAVAKLAPFQLESVKNHRNMSLSVRLKLTYSQKLMAKAHLVDSRTGECISAKYKIKEKRHCWPYIDFTLYKRLSKENDSFKFTPPAIIFTTKDIFPLERVQLDGVDTWIPNNRMLFVWHTDLRKCCSHNYSHKMDQRTQCPPTCVKCSCLREWFSQMPPEYL